MQKKDTWLLPEGIDEVLPEQAAQMEALRRKLLDAFSCWGYQLVIPPFIDFLDSLLTGSGHDLDLQTFKLTDQVSGEMLGIRADMTPQVARIDVHNLNHPWPTRLCYAGTVLHALGDALEKTRNPMQIGAELYGHSGVESDYEIIQLMLEMLSLSGLQDVHLDLGHVGIYRTLVEHAQLDSQQEATLFEVLQRKARADLQELLAQIPLNEQLRAIFTALPQLNGGLDVLDKARALLKDINPEIDRSLDELQAVADKLRRDYPSLTVSFDLAELRGYHYHTGIVFAAFVPGMGREIARGGRYDNIGQRFGRARAATGFSADLKRLLRASNSNQLSQSQRSVYAPHQNDPELAETIRDLRAEGIKVIRQLPGQTGDARTMGCTEILEKQGQRWVVTALQ